MKNQNTTEITDRLAALRQLRANQRSEGYSQATTQAIHHHQKCLVLLRAVRQQEPDRQVPEHSIWETESCGRTGWAD